ncbi:MAG TPA: MMPL family transporter, partial [Candidatus Polarisedimenticolia bacterium]|nr:MMPL family transporter [Candidatus Polarisedimenticolia bacterium]
CLLSLGRTEGSRAAEPILPMEPFVRFHAWALRRRATVLVVVALLVAGAAVAALRLEFSSDLAALRGEDPARERLESLLLPFGGAPDPVHLISEGTDRESALRGAEALEPVCRTLAGERLIDGFSTPADWLPSEASQRKRFAGSPAIDWGRVAGDFRSAAESLELREAFFAPFLDAVSRYGDFDRVRIDVGAPRVAGGLGAPMLSDRAALVTLFPGPGVEPAQLVSRARSLQDEQAGGSGAPGASIRAASVGLVVSDLVRIIEQDFRRASLIALAAVGLIALAAFRRPSALLLVAFPVLTGFTIMLGGLALLGIPINLMNLVAAPLVFGLGIDFGVYMVNRHLEEGRRDVAKVLRHTGGAILLTGLTTLAGFGSLLSADFAGLRSMGWVAVLGIGGCLFSALLILPLLLPGGTGGAGEAGEAGNEQA